MNRKLEAAIKDVRRAEQVNRQRDRDEEKWNVVSEIRSLAPPLTRDEDDILSDMGQEQLDLVLYIIRCER